MEPDLRERAIEATNDDYVYFAEFEGMVIRSTGVTDHAEVLRAALAAATELVLEGAIVPGDLGWANEDFAPWPLTPEESVARIEREVAEHLRAGTNPDMGDICWFDLPARIAERERRKDEPVKDA
ncbi:MULTISPECIES: hypothetical protein [Actinosynnema]|uniref:hypothetical protein n=1 Tax=Actinosynnema TaxID=40566 RepID=UPI0020A40F22|nr:hypothetical protein [Actinosynnema pretiosum]MCP2095984.1 hypothetical protein [Actinosynnema pretiosum]